MTIGTLVLMIGAIAVVLSILTAVFKKHKALVVTFLQHFCGVLFIFSGLVKAVDSLGTAYKMEQYFAEFEATFADTAFGFLAPLFPFLSGYSVGFAVFMIVLEIVIGLMLVLGYKNKLTAWIFFAIVVFFTILTGFTFLTGYVPSGENFFSFKSWGPYTETNMRVTDCGCFGDFIKLKPKVSFIKDVVILLPAIVFILRNKSMHSLFTKQARAIASGVALVATTWYCLSNFAWDIPNVDFRPFKEGVNIREQKDAEEQALADVEILGYEMTNKETGEVVKLEYETYLKTFADYPKETWESEQLMGEPAIKSTKISDFYIEDFDGYEVTEDILYDENYAFMLIAHKMYGKGSPEKQTVMRPFLDIDVDTITVDSMNLERSLAHIDSLRNLSDSMVKEEVTVMNYEWKERYIEDWKAMASLLDKARASGYNGYAIVGGASEDMLKDLAEETGFSAPFYIADDILLKTIVRSNPGIVLIKDGTIIKKWHKSKLPAYEDIVADYMAN